MSNHKTKKPAVKVLALACSPSKGFNSDNMLDAFLEGVRKVKGVRVEKIYLSDLKIDNYSFFNRVPDPLKDPDMSMMAGKVNAAKGMIIATPTFNFGVPAALKNFMDRLSYMALDPKKPNWLAQPSGLLNHLHNFYLVSCGTPWHILLLVWPMFPSFWLRVVTWYFGAHTWGSIYGSGLNAQHLAKDDSRLMARCRAAGEKYARRLLEK